MIFVFGSNLSGHHGEGAAAVALRDHRAIEGMAEGLQNFSYAIPTKAVNWKYRLNLGEISQGVKRFMAFAEENPHLIFQVTRIGCGFAGYRDHQIAPLFMNAPSNCLFDEAWREFLPPGKKYWGTYRST